MSDKTKKKGVLEAILDPDEPLLYHLTAVETVTDVECKQTRLTLTFSHHLEVGKSGARRETAGVKVLRSLPSVARRQPRLPGKEGKSDT